MADSIKDVLDNGDLNRLADASRAMKLGTMLAPKKVTVVQAAAATILLDPPALPATVRARVTGGAAAAGPRQVTDAGGAASATVATISDDGKTLTFENTVTDAVILYVPRPAVDITSTGSSGANMGTAP